MLCWRLAINTRTASCLAFFVIFFLAGAFILYSEDPAPKDDKPAEEPKPTPEQVDQALKDFNAKYKSNVADDRVAAVETLIGTKDARITQTLCNVLKGDKDEQVQIAALKVIVQHKDANAVPTVTAIFKTCKAEQMYLAVALAKAMGAFGDKRAVDVLSSNLWQFGQGEAGQKLVRVRIATLGEIRDKSSIAALIRMMWAKEYAPQFIGAFRASLVKLTHLDFGNSRQDWQNWWSKNKNTFQIPKDPPKEKEKPARKKPGQDGGGETGGGTEPPPEEPPED